MIARALTGFSVLCLLALPARGDTGELSELVVRQAVEQARQQVAAPDRFEVVSHRFVGADPVPEGTLELIPLEVEGPNASGFVRVLFRLRVDGEPRGVARASVRGVVRGTALVARETLSGGEPISTASVEAREVDLTKLADERPLREAEDLVGLAPVRTLGVGRVLTAQALAPAPVVRRGEPVDLVVRRPGLVVTARALALGTAAPGDTVLAENTATGARVLGRVRPDGSLLVVRRAAPGRRR